MNNDCMNVIYLFVDGKQTGPYTQDQIRQAIEQGLVAREAPAWHEGLTEWIPVGGLVPVPSSTVYAPPPPPVVMPSHQDKVAPQATPHPKTLSIGIVTGGGVLLLVAAAAALWMVSTKQTTPGTSPPQASPSANPLVQAVTSVVASPGAQFVGNWIKVNGNGSDAITIENNGDQFLLTDGAQKMGAVFKDGFLMVNDTTAITYIKSSDHITFPQGGEYVRQSPEALMQLGLNDTFGLTRNYNKAIAEYSYAIHLDPHIAEAYAGRGNSYRFAGAFDNAIVDYTSALKINPNDANSYIYRGLAYCDKSNFEAAIADFNAVIKISPNDASTYFRRGSTYYITGRLSEAQADFHKFLDLSHYDSQEASERLDSSYFIWLIELEQNHQSDGPNKELADSIQKVDDAVKSSRISFTLMGTQIGHYLLGEQNEDDLLKSANGADNWDTHRGVQISAACEANFFIGEKHLLNGDTSGAKTFFQNSVDTSVVEPSFAYQCAKAKLVQLNSSIPSQ